MHAYNFIFFFYLYKLQALNNFFKTTNINKIKYKCRHRKKKKSHVKEFCFIFILTKLKPLFSCHSIYFILFYCIKIVFLLGNQTFINKISKKENEQNKHIYCLFLTRVKKKRRNRTKNKKRNDRIRDC